MKTIAAVLLGVMLTVAPARAQNVKAGTSEQYLKVGRDPQNLQTAKEILAAIKK
jgi:hypothetical protein